MSIIGGKLQRQAGNILIKRPALHLIIRYSKCLSFHKLTILVFPELCVFVDTLAHNPQFWLFFCVNTFMELQEFVLGSKSDR